jgi:legumain
MSYDDVAADEENPFPGKLFNKPDGEDVYAGCNIDYKGESVTPENFLHILKGDATKVKGGNGKVLKSTAESKVFINFADHGAPGLIAFPNEYLYANDLNAAITYMHQHKMYQEMVLYIEACESGSMFDGILANNINVYAVTAANPDESSWGTYCPPDDMVQGVEIGTCIGDLFSVNWMEDADKNDPAKETLDTQFKRVLNETTMSHVMRYGDLDFIKAPVGNFYGNLNLPEITESKADFFETLFNKAKETVGLETPVDAKRHMSAVNSRDIKLNYLYYVVQRKKSHKAQLDLSLELTKRMRTDHVFESFNLLSGARNANGPVRPRDFDCLKTLVSAYDSSCGKMDDYSLQYVKHFVQACESKLFSMEAMVSFIKTSCTY